MPFLSPQEERVTTLVAQGLNNHEIAVSLNLSYHTVKNYVFRIFKKLGINSRYKLIVWATARPKPSISNPS